MRLRPEAKVGLVVFAAIVLLISVYFFLGGFLFGAARYRIYAIFPDARKLERGADVRMAGVKVGVVSDVRLTRDSRARVDMSISRDTQIPMDSVARITTGALIGDNYLDIMPGSAREYLQSGDRIRSEQLVQFEQILEDAGDLLTELKESARNLNQLLGDREVAASLRNTAKSLERVAASSVELVESTRGIVENTAPQLTRVFENLNRATEQAIRIGEEVESIIVTDARPSIRALTEESRIVIRSLNEAILEAQRLLGTFSIDSAKIDEILCRANVAAAHAEEMMAKLNEASGSLRDLATDPELQENIRETVRNAADASDQARQLLTSLNRRFGRPAPTPVDRSALPDSGVTVNALYNTEKSDYRLDVNYTWLASPDDFYKIGAYNLGENTRVNLQGGQILDERNAFRYGLYASRLGVGYDYRMSRRLHLSTDLFRPNEPELEFRSIYYLTPSWGLYGGVQDFFHRENRDVLVGIRYNR